MCIYVRRVCTVTALGLCKPGLVISMHGRMISSTLWSSNGGPYRFLCFWWRWLFFWQSRGQPQVLWGPCPSNDSALIKERSQHWATVQQEIKALWKHCKIQPVSQNGDLSEGGGVEETSVTLKTRERHQRLVSVKTEKCWKRSCWVARSRVFDLKVKHSGAELGMLPIASFSLFYGWLETAESLLHSPVSTV